MTVVAYLDAGSGSLIASAAAAGFAGAAVVVRSNMRRVSGRFRRQDAGADETTATTDDATEADEPA